MTLNYGIADQLRKQQNPTPDEVWGYVDPAEVSVRTKRPKWTWVARVCHEIPVGRAILIPVAPGFSVERFMDNLRCSLAGAKPTLHDKFTIRRAKDDGYCVVMKSGTWAKLYREMEEDRPRKPEDVLADFGRWRVNQSKP